MALLILTTFSPMIILNGFDTDTDGTGDNADTDDDGDGVLDVNDDLPLDPTETVDTDNDGSGNNTDNDDDGDGVQDSIDKCPLDPLERLDTDNDGTCDGPDLDADGDGEPDLSDAFPLNSLEQFDTDGDGTGNNSDADIDGDGILNGVDDFPLDATNFADTDGDGIGNNTDNDDDGDGVIDSQDAFPLDVTETLDTDGDGVGNNLDSDDDNDGIIDINDAFPLVAPDTLDTDGDGISNINDSDDDGDNVADSLDAFPLNSSESVDTDGDGIGNNSDSDDDNDGIIDVNDAFPLDSVDHLDTDNDSIANSIDNDDDGDGALDVNDAFPLDNSEHLDTDGDGLGNNTDSDDDNDGFIDSEDAFTTNVLEWFDSDLDGLGNNSDTDDDGDGTVDSLDAFRLDPQEQLDSDGDGIGNNSDSDDDNDGFIDSEDDLPTDPLEHLDTDHDGIGNIKDKDDDNDGVIDALDVFPLNKDEDSDFDEDGLGNNSDSDDDNDGRIDSLDAFPLNPFETDDTDNDGIGNILDSDDDGDGTLDFYDALPLIAGEQFDTDGDLIGNNTDLDDDGDGMSDAFELKYNFDPLEKADATFDTDFDGVTNGEEAKANSNPLLDDYAPIIVPPQAVHFYADHTFTQLSLAELIERTKIFVEDGKDGKNCCQLTALGFETGAKNVNSGLYPITWRAVDNAGNVATAKQVINVHPLVNFSSKQTVAEGGIAQVDVVLSGAAPSYPLVIPFSIGGSVDSADYHLANQDALSQKITINEGTVGSIAITLTQDFELEADEELIVSFTQGVNSGIHKQHVITITENNVAPIITLSASQQGNITNIIARDAGEVVIDLSIYDSNKQDSHVIGWQLPDYLQAQISANQRQVFVTPDMITLPEENQGLIELSVTVTDSGNSSNSGNEPLMQTKFFAIPLLASLPRLSTTDTDRDGVDDLSEGFVDKDLDGLPEFMDVSNSGYFQPLHVNSAVVKLAETEPGLQLRLGKYARVQRSDGLQLSQQEIDNTGLITKDELVNQGGYFDFEIHKITPFGRSVPIVLPLAQPISEHAVYRKYSKENLWSDFVIDSNNALATSASINGVCPAPHSELYQAGLINGHTCLKLLIEDGGANDSDGLANGVVDDPGGIATASNETIAKETTPEKSSSGSFSYLLLILLFSRSFVRFK